MTSFSFRGGLSPPIGLVSPPDYPSLGGVGSGGASGVSTPGLGSGSEGKGSSKTLKMDLLSLLKGDQLRFDEEDVKRRLKEEIKAIEDQIKEVERIDDALDEWLNDYLLKYVGVLEEKRSVFRALADTPHSFSNNFAQIVATALGNNDDKKWGDDEKTLNALYEALNQKDEKLRLLAKELEQVKSIARREGAVDVEGELKNNLRLQADKNAIEENRRKRKDDYAATQVVDSKNKDVVSRLVNKALSKANGIEPNGFELFTLAAVKFKLFKYDLSRLTSRENSDMVFNLADFVMAWAVVDAVEYKGMDDFVSVMCRKVMDQFQRDFEQSPVSFVDQVLKDQTYLETFVEKLKESAETRETNQESAVYLLNCWGLIEKSLNSLNRNVEVLETYNTANERINKLLNNRGEWASGYHYPPPPLGGADDREYVAKLSSMVEQLERDKEKLGDELEKARKELEETLLSGLSPDAKANKLIDDLIKDNEQKGAKIKELEERIEQLLQKVEQLTNDKQRLLEEKVAGLGKGGANKGKEKSSTSDKGPKTGAGTVSGGGGTSGSNPFLVSMEQQRKYVELVREYLRESEKVLEEAKKAYDDSNNRKLRTVKELQPVLNLLKSKKDQQEELNKKATLESNKLENDDLIQEAEADLESLVLNTQLAASYAESTEKKIRNIELEASNAAALREELEKGDQLDKDAFALARQILNLLGEVKDKKLKDPRVIQDRIARSSPLRTQMNNKLTEIQGLKNSKTDTDLIQYEENVKRYSLEVDNLISLAKAELESAQKQVEQTKRSLKALLDKAKNLSKTLGDLARKAAASKDVNEVQGWYEDAEKDGDNVRKIMKAANDLVKDFNFDSEISQTMKELKEQENKSEQSIVDIDAKLDNLNKNPPGGAGGAPPNPAPPPAQPKVATPAPAPAPAPTPPPAQPKVAVPPPAPKASEGPAKDVYRPTVSTYDRQDSVFGMVSPIDLETLRQSALPGPIENSDLRISNQDGLGPFFADMIFCRYNTPGATSKRLLDPKIVDFQSNRTYDQVVSQATQRNKGKKDQAVYNDVTKLMGRYFAPDGVFYQLLTLLSSDSGLSVKGQAFRRGVYASMLSLTGEAKNNVHLKLLSSRENDPSFCPLSISHSKVLQFVEWYRHRRQDLAWEQDDESNWAYDLVDNLASMIPNDLGDANEKDKGLVRYNYVARLITSLLFDLYIDASNAEKATLDLSKTEMLSKPPKLVTVGGVKRVASDDEEGKLKYGMALMYYFHQFYAYPLIRALATHLRKNSKERESKDDPASPFLVSDFQGKCVVAWVNYLFKRLLNPQWSEQASKNIPDLKKMFFAPTFDFATPTGKGGSEVVRGASLYKLMSGMALSSVIPTRGYSFEHNLGLSPLAVLYQFLQTSKDDKQRQRAQDELEVFYDAAQQIRQFNSTNNKHYGFTGTLVVGDNPDNFTFDKNTRNASVKKIAGIEHLNAVGYHGEAFAVDTYLFDSKGEVIEGAVEKFQSSLSRPLQLLAQISLLAYNASVKQVAEEVVTSEGDKLLNQVKNFLKLVMSDVLSSKDRLWLSKYQGKSSTFDTYALAVLGKLDAEEGSAKVTTQPSFSSPELQVSTELLGDGAYRVITPYLLDNNTKHIKTVLRRAYKNLYVSRANGNQRRPKNASSPSSIKKPSSGPSSSRFNTSPLSESQKKALSSSSFEDDDIDSRSSPSLGTVKEHLQSALVSEDPDEVQRLVQSLKTKFVPAKESIKKRMLDSMTGPEFQGFEERLNNNANFNEFLKRDMNYVDWSLVQSSLLDYYSSH